MSRKCEFKSADKTESEAHHVPSESCRGRCIGEIHLAPSDIGQSMVVKPFGDDLGRAKQPMNAIAPLPVSATRVFTLRNTEKRLLPK